MIFRWLIPMQWDTSVEHQMSGMELGENDKCMRGRKRERCVCVCVWPFVFAVAVYNAINWANKGSPLHTLQFAIICVDKHEMTVSKYPLVFDHNEIKAIPVAIQKPSLRIKWVYFNTIYMKFWIFESIYKKLTHFNMISIQITNRVIIYNVTFNWKVVPIE